LTALSELSTVTFLCRLQPASQSVGISKWIWRICLQVAFHLLILGSTLTFKGIQALLLMWQLVDNLFTTTPLTLQRREVREWGLYLCMGRHLISSPLTYDLRGIHLLCNLLSSTHS